MQSIFFMSTVFPMNWQCLAIPKGCGKVWFPVFLQAHFPRALIFQGLRSGLISKATPQLQFVCGSIGAACSAAGTSSATG
jgi:hypothetical protein